VVVRHAKMRKSATVLVVMPPLRPLQLNFAERALRAIVHCSPCATIALATTMSKGSKARKPSAAGKKSGGVSLPVMLTVLILGALVVLAWLMMDTSSAEPPKPKRAADGASTAPSSQFASSISLKEGECGDAHEMCEPWHKAGACARSRGAGVPPPAEMRKLCPHSCGDCPGVVGRVSRVPSEARCRRDNLTAAVPSGRLKPLFERLLSDFPQYTPAALSTDPYIVQLHDFLTADEMAAFQRVCKPNFERSLAGDQLNPVRTSFQARARAHPIPERRCSPDLGAAEVPSQRLAAWRTSLLRPRPSHERSHHATRA